MSTTYYILYAYVTYCTPSSPYSEREMEAQVTIAAERETRADSTTPAISTAASIKGGEALLQAIDTYEAEVAREDTSGELLSGSGVGGGKVNPLLMNMTPLNYILHHLQQV